MKNNYKACSLQKLQALLLAIAMIFAIKCAEGLIDFGYYCILAKFD
jgi:hypothetical protein